MLNEQKRTRDLTHNKENLRLPCATLGWLLQFILLSQVNIRYIDWCLMISSGTFK